MAYLIIQIVTVLILGLVFGSFATALVWRIPRNIPWAKPRGSHARSSCVSCEKKLDYKDLIPLFSWLSLKGKCRYCGHEIGARYPLIELATLIGCLGVYLVWGYTVPAFIIMIAVPLLVALVAIDLEHMILPNQLVFILAGLAAILLVYQWAGYGLDFGFGRQALFKIAGMIIYGGLAYGLGYGMQVLLKKEALGMGDVKFFAMAGLWLGITYLPFFLIFSGFSGLLIGVFYRFYYKEQLFPFGPALILSLYVGLLLQGLEIVPLIGVQ